MTQKISLQNRQRTREFTQGIDKVTQEKKDQLLAMKLQELNDTAVAAGKLFELPLNLIYPDPDQPRKTFKNMQALTDSVREQGVLQPILVKPKSDESGLYQIIVGERRYQAAKMAGLLTLPCVIREKVDASTVILQLLENDQREQVSLLEEARAVAKLVDQMGVPKHELARELGRDPSWISLRLGLMDAPPEIQALAEDEIVQDLRTLHELRKLQAENAPSFKTVLRKLREQDFQGSHRELLRKTRAAKTATPRILKIEHHDGRLFLFIEKKRKPLEFQVDHDVLSLLTSLNLT